MAEYTSKGVPKINPKTWESAKDRYIGRRIGNRTDWGQLLTEVQQRIIDEDPSIREYMEMQASQFPRELHDLVFSSLVGLYAIIEAQIDTNRTEENLSPH
jgi:hypothetical protein